MNILSFMERAFRYANHRYQNIKIGVLENLGYIRHKQIVPTGTNGRKIYVFKKESIEHVEILPIYGFISSGSFDVEYPEISLYCYKDAIVVGSADYVITGNGNVIWPKYYNYNYHHNIVRDALFVNEDDGSFYYKKPKKVVECEVVFSFLGVFAHIWAHSIVEFFPKFKALEYLVQSNVENITVLIPPIKDLQLRQLFIERLAALNVTILEVEKNVAVHAKEVYYMERPTRFTDHEESIYIGDCVIPNVVADYIKSEIVEKYNTEVISSEYKKIYITRRGGNGKNLEGAHEIEDFFVSHGFKVIEPNMTSLSDKIEMFQSAEVIVGLLGGAFTNMFMCRPGTKILMLTNHPRQFENYLSMVKSNFGVDILCVNGYDDNKKGNPTHCSYKISLEKIKMACKAHGIIE